MTPRSVRLHLQSGGKANCGAAVYWICATYREAQRPPLAEPGGENVPSARKPCLLVNLSCLI